MKSLLHIVEERSGVLSDDVLLMEVLSDLIQHYPGLKDCTGAFDSWTWFEYQGNDIATNSFGDEWTDDGYVCITVYETNENGVMCGMDNILGNAKFNLTMMQNALQGAALWD